MIKNVGIEDAGLYTVSAKNEHGETVQQARLNVHSEYYCDSSTELKLASSFNSLRRIGLELVVTPV